MTTQQAFEEWAKDFYPEIQLQKNPSGIYINSQTRYMYEGYQAGYVDGCAAGYDSAMEAIEGLE